MGRDTNKLPEPLGFEMTEAEKDSFIQFNKSLIDSTEMSNDKMITETLPVKYKGWVIAENHNMWSHAGKSFQYIFFQIGNEHESTKYSGSIEEAKELIDEKQN